MPSETRRGGRTKFLAQCHYFRGQHIHATEQVLRGVLKCLLGHSPFSTRIVGRCLCLRICRCVKCPAVAWHWHACRPADGQFGGVLTRKRRRCSSPKQRSVREIIANKSECTLYTGSESVVGGTLALYGGHSCANGQECPPHHESLIFGDKPAKKLVYLRFVCETPDL